MIDNVVAVDNLIVDLNMHGILFKQRPKDAFDMRFTRTAQRQIWIIIDLYFVR